MRDPHSPRRFLRRNFVSLLIAAFVNNTNTPATYCCMKVFCVVSCRKPNWACECGERIVFVVFAQDYRSRGLLLDIDPNRGLATTESPAWTTSHEKYRHEGRELSTRFTTWIIRYISSNKGYVVWSRLRFVEYKLFIHIVKLSLKKFCTSAFFVERLS